MNVVFINSSDIFELRIIPLYQELKRQGHMVKVISSDYRHIEKNRRFSDNEDFIFLHTLAYKKNISLKRLLSHICFSWQAYKQIKDEAIDVLYIVIPPNSQVLIAKKFAKKKFNTKIIMDIIDMWPESLPVGYTDKFPFTLWKSLRNRNLKYAHYIVTECKLYQKKLEAFLKGKNTSTVYWSKEIPEVTSCIELPSGILQLCYLGSINNITDLDAIESLIEKLTARIPVRIKLIGAGEKKGEFVKRLSNLGVVIEDLGKIYNFEQKQKVFNQCHFGLNMMKKEVCIGLTMKSIDYLAGGLPIINNVPGDTEELIEKEKIGINWKQGENIQDILDLNQEKARKQAQKIYHKYFRVGDLKNQLIEIINIK